MKTIKLVACIIGLMLITILQVCLYVYHPDFAHMDIKTAFFFVIKCYGMLLITLAILRGVDFYAFGRIRFTKGRAFDNATEIASGVAILAIPFVIIGFAVWYWFVYLKQEKQKKAQEAAHINVDIIPHDDSESAATPTQEEPPLFTLAEAQELNHKVETNQATVSDYERIQFLVHEVWSEDIGLLEMLRPIRILSVEAFIDERNNPRRDKSTVEGLITKSILGWTESLIGYAEINNELHKLYP